MSNSALSRHFGRICYAHINPAIDNANHPEHIGNDLITRPQVHFHSGHSEHEVPSTGPKTKCKWFPHLHFVDSIYIQHFSPITNVPYFPLTPVNFGLCCFHRASNSCQPPGYTPFQWFPATCFFISSFHLP
uniref:Uncharacterized protein n=1 Tax=Molossus molossus TaxID=27622 RepID=A0A7J8FZ69_MOLMO|nr:hypothetical protein HJG59_008266 [Molossus molossus]